MAVFRTGTSIVPAPLPGVASANNLVTTNETTSSDSYTALTTAQSVTLTTGTKVLVIIGCSASNDSSTAGFRMAYSVSGATTVAMGNSGALIMSRNNNAANVTYSYSRHSYLTVNAGSNTFTVNFSRSNGSGTASFSDRYITVIDLGS